MDNLAADFIIDLTEPLQAEFDLTQEEPINCTFEVYASGTVWGSISGDINNQTDLIELIENNYNDLEGQITTLDIKVDNNYNELSNGLIEANQDILDLTNTVNSNFTTLNNKIDEINIDLSADISELNTAIQNEAATRAENDTLLQNNINTLSQTVTANYNTLDGKIDTEISNRTTADTTLQGNIDTLSGTVTSNYNALDARITTNTGNISDINTTLSGYGNIVTHNVSEFATSAQGALADTALQPNDNISELVNDVGYITSASLPTDYVPETRTINGYALSSNITLNYTDVNALSASTTINDLTTIAQQNALNSGATTTNIGQITTNANNISDIQGLIPNQATSSNQLADKSFVNSSIATNTANFIGTFNSVAELEAYTGTLTNNDYAFVATTDTAGNTLYDRYKYNADTQEWLFEYELNNSSFTAQQWASINSGITSGDVTLIETALQPNDNISELTNDVGYITSASLPIVNNGTLDIQVNGTSVGTFTANQSGNTTANIVVPNSATWGNITGTLSNQTDLQTALNSKLSNSGNGGNRSLGIMGTITSSRTEGTWIGYSSEAANWSTACGFQAKATGQTSIAIGWNAKATSTNSIQIGYGTNSTPNTLSIGFNNTSYTLLNGTTGLIPDARISSDIARTSQIPTNNNQLTNGAGYITASALTPYALSADLASVATSGDYDDLINKPTIPTVNNGTLTIQKNGTTIGTFTANQSTNSTINIEADTVLTDDVTVSKNSDDELQAIGVIDYNSGNAIKTWTGTKAQYDAIVTKDATTLYWVTDVKIIYLGETPVGNFSGERNVGEIITASLPLADAGLHLLDGSLILGGGIYQGFVDYIAELYDNTPISGYKSNVTKVGSLADNNGVLSGFSLNNYAQIQMPNFNNASSFSLVLKIKLNSIPSANVNFFASSASNQVITGSITSSGKVGMAIGTGSAWSITETTAVGTTTLQINTDYWIKIEFTGSAYILSLSIDGETWNTEYTYTSSAKLPYSSSYNFNIGRSRDTNTSSGTYISGSIDLKSSYIDIDNSRWWTGAEAIKPIFCTEEQWQQSVTTYGVCGKFVYDSTNNTVRLPKITGIIEGTTDISALGDLVEESLPTPSHTHTRGTMEITGRFGSGEWDNVNYTQGAFYKNGTYTQGATGGDRRNLVSFSASRNWSGSTSQPNNLPSTYQDNAPVQPQTIKCFVYIVIATSTKTDVQVDIDDVVTDLNGKADTDLSNCTKPHIVETYVNGTSWYRVYSDGWCEQGGFQTSSGVQYYLKPFKDNNYTLLSKGQGTYSSTSAPSGTSVRQNYTQTISSYNSTSFTTGFDTNWKIWWYACGYIS